MSRFMTGALLGLAVGLLIAPEKGEDTRDAIADTAEKWKDKFNRLVGRAGARLDDLKSMLGNEIEGLSEDARNKIQKILSESNSGSGAAGGRSNAGAAQSQAQNA